MRKATKILYLVGAIIAIVLAAVNLFSGVTSVVLGSVGLSNRWLVSKLMGKPEAELTNIMIISYCSRMIAKGSWQLFEIPLCILSSVFAFKAREDGSKNNAVLNIVFGVLSGSMANAVGGIFNLITNNIERNDKVVSDQ